ncbi:MAG TPA: Sec-independent protein translocase protein TatB [Alphaproteobacteria bacterium]|nr:Sec-independent protein translocase protein TatB [Alphaproteobacteria bacterium]
MFDMSWSELLLIAVVALIAIGPKDLPKVLKTFAQFARKARSLARDFQSGIEEIAREAELHEVKRQIEGTVNTDLGQTINHTIDPGGEVAKSLDMQAETAASVPTVEPQTSPVPSIAHEAGSPPATVAIAATEAAPVTPRLDPVPVAEPASHDADAPAKP